MSYKSISDNPAFKAGKEHGRFIEKQIMPHTVKKREFNMCENQVNIEKRLRSEYENYSNRKNHN